MCTDYKCSEQQFKINTISRVPCAVCRSLTHFFSFNKSIREIGKQQNANMQSVLKPFNEASLTCSGWEMKSDHWVQMVSDKLILHRYTQYRKRNGLRVDGMNRKRGNSCSTYFCDSNLQLFIFAPIVIVCLL